MVRKSIAAVLASASLLAPLSSQAADDEVFKLKDLIPIYVSATSDIAKVSTDKLIEHYKDLLKFVTDPQVQSEIYARIADLELLLQDQLVAKSEEEGGKPYIADYRKAIAAYKEVLKRFPDRARNDAIYYQLAKAYDLSGNSQAALNVLTTLVEEYPYSIYFIEAQFRRGDFLYGLRQYSLARDAYQSVVDNGQATAFYENAVYMHGWALFKLNFYEESLRSFSIVLDGSMPPNGLMEGVAQNKVALVEDSVRIMGIIFTYLNGGQSITDLFAEVGPRAYEGMLYERLGDLYVDQERYQDAIDTYRAYMERNPMGDKVPELHNKIIDTMLLARFYNKAFEEKEIFIRSYDIDTIFYGQARPVRQEYVREFLYVYNDEVARFYHAKAQQARKKLRQYKEPPPAILAEMQKHYTTAIQYYERFLLAFPNDVHASEKSFLLGEAYYELEDYQKAIEAYERTAYQFPISVYSEDAAYAAIQGYKKLIEQNTLDWERQSLVAAKLEAQLVFSQYFGFSVYSKPILLDSIDTLFNEKTYEKAITQAEQFLELDPPGTAQQRLAVWMVLGHSYFETAKYPEAENAYKSAMALLDKKDPRREDLDDRIAASIYRTAEMLVAQGKMPEAVDEFLRVASTSPNSQYRKNAEYDAASYLIMLEDWPRALKVVQAYRDRYDPEKLSLDVTSKLLAAYEGLSMWGDAADEMVRIYELTPDPTKKRQSLFLAAEYYEKAGNDDRALAILRDYAHLYPEPFDLAMEVRFRLSEMYLKRKDDARRRYWLEKIVKADAEAGDQRTDRSRYLAAFALNFFAEDYRVAFNEIKLTLPLKKSLPRKRAALEEAMNRYQEILDYGVQEFSTQATYYMGEIFAQLSRDLMDSERPENLDALVLEQYEFLLEEQAYPFEEKAIAIHESNLKNAWNGLLDSWIQKSLMSLSKLLPGRYNKPEVTAGYSDEIF